MEFFPAQENWIFQEMQNNQIAWNHCYFQVIFSDVKENLKVYSCFLYSFRKMWNLFPDILKRSQKYAKIEILTKGKNMVFNIF